MSTYRYLRWDDNQQDLGIYEKDILDHADMRRALRNLFQRGQCIDGLRNLVERLRHQRQ